MDIFAMLSLLTSRILYFNFRAQIEGTGRRSEVSRVNIVQFIMYFCITYLRSWHRGT